MRFALRGGVNVEDQARPLASYSSSMLHSVKFLSGSQEASSIGCTSGAESTPSVRNCIRCHLEGSGRKVLGSVAIRLVSSNMLWKNSRKFQDVVPEGSWSTSIPESYRGGGNRPLPLTPSHWLLYSLDFVHSRLFSAFLGHLRAYLNINMFGSRAPCASIG